MQTGHKSPHIREKPLTLQTDPRTKRQKGSQDNVGSKLTLKKKTIISILGKIKEDFACMEKSEYYFKRQSKYKNESVEFYFKVMEIYQN